jgi:hypothetical protein
VKEVNRVYDAIVDVASARSAHMKAYEAAMATLFKLEMEAIALDPSQVDGKTQHEAAFAAVNAKIGQPPHKADRKYHIEAFLLSIELRLMLAQIASARVAELPSFPTNQSTIDTERSGHIRWVPLRFLHQGLREGNFSRSFVFRSQTRSSGQHGEPPLQLREGPV